MIGVLFGVTPASAARAGRAVGALAFAFGHSPAWAVGVVLREWRWRVQPRRVRRAFVYGVNEGHAAAARRTGVA